MELTEQEKSDLQMAVITRMGRIQDMLDLDEYKDSKMYKDEYERMIILKHKILL